MKNNIFKKGISFCVLLFLSILIPNISVQAETNKNFSVNVETDKDQYSEDEVVTYKVTIKNINDNNATDLIIYDQLPEGVVIVETDGKVDGQKVTWEKEELNMKIKSLN